MNITEIKTADQHAQTLESLVSSLDERGLLVFQVLLGQRSMELLSKKHEATVTKPNILKPH